MFLWQVLKKKTKISYYIRQFLDVKAYYKLSMIQDHNIMNNNVDLEQVSKMYEQFDSNFLPNRT